MSERSFREPRRRGFDDEVFAPRRPRGFGAPAPRRQLPTGPPTRATVKWFSPEKGFGFVVLNGGRGDAFLHARVLEQSCHDGPTLQPVLAGDRVTVEMTPYDLSKGRITFRQKVEGVPARAPARRPQFRRR